MDLSPKTDAAPFLPAVAGNSDTSNFDPYPDSLKDAPLPEISGPDPFEGF